MKRILVSPYVVEERAGDISFDPNVERERSMTKQSFADETDVNQIVDRAIKTGILGDPVAMASRVATFGDFTNCSDFHDTINRVLNAQRAFLELPLDVRVRFNNDPGQLIDFLADPRNVDEGVKLGLLPKELIEAKIAAEQKAKAEAAEQAAQAQAKAVADAKAQAPAQ